MPILRVLKSAVATDLLPLANSNDAMSLNLNRLGGRTATVSDVGDRWEVTRDDLVAFADQRGERPRFLFKKDRGDRHFEEALAKLEGPARAQTAYKMRKITGGIGDPVAMGARAIEREKQRAAAEAEKERRRALIKTGRDLAFGYCDGDQEETFREYLEGQRGYSDIRPHLSQDYRRKLEAVRMTYADADGARYPSLVQWFLDDLDRLEEEWGLI
jgi:hypothetical protein